MTEARRTRGATCVTEEATLLVTAQERRTEIGIGEDPGLATEIEMATDEAVEVDLHVMTGTDDEITEGLPEVTQEVVTGTDLDLMSEEVTDMIETGVTTADGTDPTEMRTETVGTGTEKIEERADGIEIEAEGQADQTPEATGEPIDPGLDLGTERIRETIEMDHPMIDRYQPIEGPGLMTDGLKALVENRMTKIKSPTTNQFQEEVLNVEERAKTSQNRLLRMEPLLTQRQRHEKRIWVKMQKSFNKTEQSAILIDF